MQVLLVPSPLCLLGCAWWCGGSVSLGRAGWGALSGGSFCWGSNIKYCLLLGQGGGRFLLFLRFYVCRLLTVARSRVLDLQQSSQGASGLFHGAFAGICGVIAGAHRLIRPALRAGFLAQRAAAPAHPSVPQALFPSAALDVLTRLGLWKFRGDK